MLDMASARMSAVVRLGGPRCTLALAENLLQRECVTLEEFVSSLRSSGLSVSTGDAEALSASLEVDDEGYVDSVQALRAVLGPASPQRAAALRHIFNAIDAHRQGAITPKQALACFAPALHPDVRAGRASALSIKQDLVRALRCCARGAAAATFEAFADAHAVLAARAEDGAAAAALEACWHAPQQQQQRSGAEDGDSCAAAARGATHALTRLRHAARARGVRGLAALRRALREADGDGDGHVARGELRRVSAALALGLGDIDVEELFSVLGKPGPGGVIKTLDTAALLAAARGELQGRRLAVVEEAFRSLDEACCGAVPVETLLQRFAAEGHPDVVARARDAAEVLTEWLETVDVSGDAPGCATCANFVDYYTSLSATIASDDAFEAIVRGTWRLPPAAAAAAALSHGVTAVTAGADADWMSDGGGDHERGFAHAETQSEASAGSEESLQGSSPQSAHEGVRGSGGGGRRLTLGECAAVPPAPPSVTSEDAAVARAGAGARYHTAPSAAAAAGAAAAAAAAPDTGSARATAASGAAAAAAAAAEAEVPHGLRAVLARLQRAAARGGMRGVTALSRELRAAAAQHCGTLGLREYKRVLCAGQGRRSSGSSGSSSSSAAAAAAAVLTEAEARMLFSYLDAGGTGRVPPARVMDLVRGALPPRARALAAAAFQNLLKNSGGRGAARLAGRGLVDARELVRCFDAAAHPDVRAGRATAEAVLREFLDTFECGAAAEGHVSAAEFEEYHAGAALCLRNSGGGGGEAAAAALEELIRGCWALPHGAAASDGGSSPWSALEAEAQHHHENNSIDRGGVRRLYHAGSHGVTQCLGGTGGGTAAPPPRPGPASPQRAVKLRSGRIEAPVLPRGPDAGLLSVMNSITAQMRARGPAGFVGLRRALRTAAGGSGGGGTRLTLGQLKGALEAVAADVGDAEARMLHAHLAAVHNDQQPLGRGATVALADVVAALRPPLPPRRAALAKAAFAAMYAAAAAAPAASARPAIAAEQAAARFDAAQHPDVACGARPAHAVLGEMLEALEASAAAGGVTRADFLEYAACVSAAELSDARYEHVMRGCWGLGAGDIAAAAAPAEAAAAAVAAAAQGPVDAPRAKAHVYRHSRPSAAPGVLPGTTSQRKAAAMAAAKETAMGRAEHARQAAAAAAAAPVTSGGDDMQPDVGVQVALSAARARLAGVAGAAAAARALSAADGDCDGLLTLREFRCALADAEAGLDDGELRTVFAYLDEHATGFIPVRRAAAALRPPLSLWRRACVRAAFARVAAVLCDGEPAVATAAAAAVPLEALLGALNAAHHPEVVAARAAAADVRRDFSDGIQALNVHDGGSSSGDAVTLADFEAYYAALGGGIASDDYFELLLRGCWGLAEGALPASPVRRRHAPRAAAPLAGSDPTPLAVTERLASRMLPPPPPLPPPDAQPLPPPPPRVKRWCGDAGAAGPCGNGAWLTRRLRDSLAAQPGAFTALRRSLAVVADQYDRLVAWSSFSRALAAPALALTQTDRQCLFDHFAARAAGGGAQHKPAYVDVDDFLDTIEPAAGDAGADSHLPPSAPPPLPPPPPMVTRFAARDAAAAARPQSASLIQPHVSAAAAAAAAAGAAAAAAVNLEARRQRLKALAGSHIDFAVPLPLEHRPGRRLSTRAMAAHLTGAKVECEGDGGRGTERAHVSAPHAHPFADHLWGEQRELLQEAGQQQRQQRQGGGKRQQAAAAARDVQPLAEAAAAAAAAEVALLAAAAQQRQQQQQLLQQRASPWPSRQQHDYAVSEAGSDAESVRRFCGRRHITPRNVPGAAGVTTTGKGHGVFSDGILQPAAAMLVAPARMASVLSPTWASSIVLG